ncbi:Gp19/Gp15/Gp42 family protein [Streptomyces sp. LZ34]
MRARIPDLDERVAASEHYRALVVSVEAGAVVRVLRNPGGYRSETDENYAYTIDTRAAAGFLTILDEEWSLLGAARGASTAVPYLDPIPHDPRHLVRYPRGTGPYLPLDHEWWPPCACSTLAPTPSPCARRNAPQTTGATRSGAPRPSPSGSGAECSRSTPTSPP